MAYEDGCITFKLYNKKDHEQSKVQSKMNPRTLTEQRYNEEEYKINKYEAAKLTKYDIDSMIDIALLSGDKVWFNELVNMRNELVKQ